ncbi:hypothetical protein EON65_56515 [archaeon]|nr:MAG: hypothetical protein EON65_56515 [archaeon]
MPRISVGVRIRPDLVSGERRIDNFVVLNDSKSIDFFVSEVNHSFQFDDIFQEQTCQGQVFQASTSSIVDAALEGYNGTVFAYGQTGAG